MFKKFIDENLCGGDTVIIDCTSEKIKLKMKKGNSIEFKDKYVEIVEIYDNNCNVKETITIIPIDRIIKISIQK